MGRNLQYAQLGINIQLFQGTQTHVTNIVVRHAGYKPAFDPNLASDTATFASEPVNCTSREGDCERRK